MKKILILLITGLIKIYQYLISPLFASSCRFYPTCSAYALEAIQLYGPMQGTIMAVKRLGRCHPWHPGGVDLVPDPEAKKQEISNNRRNNDSEDDSIE